MGVFIRFVVSPEQAKRDFERGFSYRGYQVFDTYESAAESDFVEYYGCSEDDIAPMCDARTGENIGYGFTLPGLCGFDYTYSDDIAAEARQHNSMNYAADSYDYVAIFEGEYIEEADGADGDVFRAKRLVTVVNL